MKIPLYDTHMHTPLCRHATGMPEEYARVAAEKGFAGITFTCHCPLIDGRSRDVRMDISELDRYQQMVAAARSSYEGRVDVLLGLESDYYPGVEPWLEDLHTRAPFHYILGSVHPHIEEYIQAYFKGDPREFQLVYFGHLADAAETGLFDCISHPDLVKNCYPQCWNPDQILDHICRALDRIAKTGIAMELNTSGLNKVIPEMNPGPLMLRQMRQRDIPVVIGSDSHVPERVGADFRLALDQLRQAGYSEVSYFIERKRRTVTIAELIAELVSSGLDL